MPRVRKGDVVWVEPELVARSSSSSGRTTATCARPSYQGLREDKEPEEVATRGAAARSEIRTRRSAS